jgi:hypothetical protein
MRTENSWHVGEWQECSGTCYNGGYGVKKRSVVCIIQRPNEFDDSLEVIGMLDSDCNSEARPLSIKRCQIDIKKCTNESSETNYWIAEEWTNVNGFKYIQKKKKTINNIAFN